MYLTLVVSVFGVKTFGPVIPKVLSILENSTSWSMVSNAALRSRRISITIPCWSMLVRMSFCTFASAVSLL